jgi:hypothetical protein
MQKVVVDHLLCLLRVVLSCPFFSFVAMSIGRP